MKVFLFFILLGVASYSYGQSNSGNTEGRGLSFIPDFTFKGSTLDGWKSFGNAVWSARDGELTGIPKQGSSGWLILNRSFQDIGINTLIKVTRGSEAGILFRAEKNGDGMKGVMLLIKDDSSGAYTVKLDAQGKIISSVKLRPAVAVNSTRLAAPPNPAATNTVRSGINGAYPANIGVIPFPDMNLKAGEWNQLECIMDLNMLKGYINDGGGPVGATDSIEFGPIALYVNGPGEVRFKDFKYKDLALRFQPKEQTSDHFHVQQISDMYYSWSATSADFNNDGVLDVAAGPYIYYGPDYTKFREIYPGFALNPSKEYPEVSCQYAFDFNNDGWMDIFTSQLARLYINPKGESRRWNVYQVIPGNINTEVTVMTDIDGDKRPELIYGTNSNKTPVLKYAKFDPADPTKPWMAHTISEPGYFMPHGIGAGDINGDGRVDILNPNGWWEQPATNDSGLWAYHSEAFARFGHRGSNLGASVMGVYDVNGDKLNDVVTSLNPHGFGLAWFEQKKDAAGKISFVRHMIIDDYSTKNAGNVTFSQSHGATFADVDGDGITDFITGKRYFSHVDSYADPDPFSPPVLYWFRTVRDPKAPGGAVFVPELVHNRSGTGSDVLAIDLNRDGAMDIISSNDRGTFIFWNKKEQKRK